MEDWLPTHIPDGYMLLYSETGYGQNGHIYRMFHTYVPNTFELTEDTKSFAASSISTTS